MQLLIMMPVYEDSDAAIELCRKLDLVFREETSLRVSLLLIDDGSTVSRYPREIPFRPEAIEHISILALRRNLGHQRAIAIGLAHIHQHRKGDAVVVMDADGQDRPEDIPTLVRAMRDAEHPTAVFAERGRRIESATFRFFYRCYSVMHRVLTGRDIRFGNFSVLPWSHLDSLVVFPELWNHYSATVIKSRLPYIRVRSDRAVRLAGQSKMNFVGLVIHGLSALFANQEVVGTRLLLMTTLTTMGLFLVISIVIGVGLLAHSSIPGWAITMIGLLLIFICQSLVGCVILVFSIMMNRSNLGFLPIRDYSYFVRDETILQSSGRATP